MEFWGKSGELWAALDKVEGFVLLTRTRDLECQERQGAQNAMPANKNKPEEHVDPNRFKI